MLTPPRWQTVWLKSLSTPQNYSKKDMHSSPDDKILDDLARCCSSTSKDISLKALECWRIWINNKSIDEWKKNETCYFAVSPLLTKKYHPLHKDVEVSEVKLHLLWLILHKVQFFMDLEGPQHVLEVFIQSCVSLMSWLENSDLQKLILKLLCSLFTSEVLKGSENFPPLVNKILKCSKLFCRLICLLIEICQSWTKFIDKTDLLCFWSNFLDHCEQFFKFIPVVVWHKIFKIVESVCGNENELIHNKIALIHKCAIHLKSVMSNPKFIDCNKFLTSPAEALLKTAVELCINNEEENISFEIFSSCQEIGRIFTDQIIHSMGYEFCIYILSKVEDIQTTALHWGLWCGLAEYLVHNFSTLQFHEYSKLEKKFYRKLRGIAVNFDLDKPILEEQSVSVIEDLIKFLKIENVCRDPTFCSEKETVQKLSQMKSSDTYNSAENLISNELNFNVDGNFGFHFEDVNEITVSLGEKDIGTRCLMSPITNYLRLKYYSSRDFKQVRSLAENYFRNIHGRTMNYGSAHLNTNNSFTFLTPKYKSRWYNFQNDKDIWINKEHIAKKLHSKFYYSNDMLHTERLIHIKHEDQRGSLFSQLCLTAPANAPADYMVLSNFTFLKEILNKFQIFSPVKLMNFSGNKIGIEVQWNSVNSYRVNDGFCELNLEKFPKHLNTFYNLILRCVILFFMQNASAESNGKIINALQEVSFDDKIRTANNSKKRALHKNSRKNILDSTLNTFPSQDTNHWLLHRVLDSNISDEVASVQEVNSLESDKCNSKPKKRTRSKRHRKLKRFQNSQSNMTLRSHNYHAKEVEIVEEIIPGCEELSVQTTTHNNSSEILQSLACNHFPKSDSVIKSEKISKPHRKIKMNQNRGDISPGKENEFVVPKERSDIRMTSPNWTSTSIPDKVADQSINPITKRKRVRQKKNYEGESNKCAMCPCKNAKLNTYMAEDSSRNSIYTLRQRPLQRPMKFENMKSINCNKDQKRKCFKSQMSSESPSRNSTSQQPEPSTPNETPEVVVCPPRYELFESMPDNKEIFCHSVKNDCNSTTSNLTKIIRKSRKSGVLTSRRKCSEKVKKCEMSVEEKLTCLKREHSYSSDCLKNLIENPPDPDPDIAATVNNILNDIELMETSSESVSIISKEVQCDFVESKPNIASPLIPSTEVNNDEKIDCLQFQCVKRRAICPVFTDSPKKIKLESIQAVEIPSNSENTEDDISIGITNFDKLNPDVSKNAAKSADIDEQIITPSKIDVQKSNITVINSRGSRMLALIPESPKIGRFLDTSPSSKYQTIKPPNVCKNSRASKMLALLPELVDSNTSLKDAAKGEASIYLAPRYEENYETGNCGFTSGKIHHCISLKNGSQLNTESPKRRSIRFDDDKNETLTYYTDSPPCQISKQGLRFKRRESLSQNV